MNSSTAAAQKMGFRSCNTGCSSVSWMWRTPTSFSICGPQPPSLFPIRTRRKDIATILPDARHRHGRPDSCERGQASGRALFNGPTGDPAATSRDKSLELCFNMHNPLSATQTYTYDGVNRLANVYRRRPELLLACEPVIARDVLDQEIGYHSLAVLHELDSQPREP
jgi:hypothetical protein